jgi:integrase
MANAGQASKAADKPATVAGLVLAWRELHDGEDHKYRIANFARAFGHLPLSAVESDLITDLKRTLERQGYASKTVIDRVRTSAACLRWGIDQGWIHCEVRVPKMRRPQKLERDIDPARVAAALADCPRRAGRALRFIAATGARPLEVCRLRWSDIHLKRRCVVVVDHKTADKTGDVRTIMLTPPALTVLREIPHRKGHVFVSRLGTPYTVSGLRSIWQRRINATLYSLRHTFAQVASEQVPADVLSKLMGHKSSDMTRHYYAIRDRRALALATALDLPQVADVPPPPVPAKLVPSARTPKTCPAQDRRKAKRKARAGGSAVRRQA